MTLSLVLGAIAAKLSSDAILDYLYPDALQDEILPTTAIPSAAPYVPPFLGGQCRLGANVGYWFIPTSFRNIEQGQTYNSNNTAPFGNGAIQLAANLSVSSVTFVRNGTRTASRIVMSNGTIKQDNLGFGNNSDTDNLVTDIVWNLVLYNYGTSQVIADNCGNLPDPNPPNLPIISDGGAPQNGTPSVTNGDDLVEAGLPVIALPSILPFLIGLAAQVGAAIAAAQAAADALTAIKAVADALKKLSEQLEAYKELFDKLREYLNQKEREEAAKKEYFIRQFGIIRKDGYLDITPRPAPVGFKPLMLDFRCSQVPNAMGRFFGKDSYNWFRYQELGSICFLSPTSGVLSVHKIEHVRTSIAIPELAIGFTFNLGLNGVIRARVSMLYTEEKN